VTLIAAASLLRCHPVVPTLVCPLCISTQRAARSIILVQNSDGEWKRIDHEFVEAAKLQFCRPFTPAGTGTCDDTKHLQQAF
jgi:hypothetical protein